MMLQGFLERTVVIEVGISFLNELELVICNGRRCVSEPEWTRV